MLIHLLVIFPYTFITLKMIAVICKMLSAFEQKAKIEIQILNWLDKKLDNSINAMLFIFLQNYNRIYPMDIQ